MWTSTTREWGHGNEPAAIPAARRRGVRRSRQAGVIGTPAIPSHGGLTSARRCTPKRRTVAITPPLNQLPWDVAKDQFGPPGADFSGVMGALIVRTAKDQICPYLADLTAVPGTLPLSPQKTSPGLPHTRTRSPDHAPGVSPARPAMGASASSRAAPPAPTAGLAG